MNLTCSILINQVESAGWHKVILRLVARIFRQMCLPNNCCANCCIFVRLHLFLYASHFSSNCLIHSLYSSFFHLSHFPLSSILSYSSTIFHSPFSITLFYSPPTYSTFLHPLPPSSSLFLSFLSLPLSSYLFLSDHLSSSLFISLPISFFLFLSLPLYSSLFRFLPLHILFVPPSNPLCLVAALPRYSALCQPAS